MKLQIDLNTKMDYCLLAVTKDYLSTSEKSLDSFFSSCTDEFKRIFRGTPMPEKEVWEERLKSLIGLGRIYIDYSDTEKGIFKQLYLTSEGRTAFSESRLEMVKYLKHNIKYGDRDGIVKMAERVLKSGRILMSIFWNDSTFDANLTCSMMLTSGFRTVEDRIFLTIPLLREKDYDDRQPISDPEPAFMCINAFAMFLTIQGSEVFVVKAEKSDNEIELFGKTKTTLDLYDAHNPPKQFDVFNYNRVEELANMELPNID